MKTEAELKEDLKIIQDSLDNAEYNGVHILSRDRVLIETYIKTLEYVLGLRNMPPSIFDKQ